MADPRAKQGERVISQPAGVTVLPDELARSQNRLGQGADATLHAPLPAFKAFPAMVNLPTGQEQATFNAPPAPTGARPDFKPTPGSINVPHGEEQVTLRRRSP
jgi:hypothetical protein